MQTILSSVGSINKIDIILNNLGCHKVLLVCSKSSYKYLPIKIELESIHIVCFSDFSPNPLYEDVCKGVDLFKKESCDSILAVGGGSSIDVGKCIKLFCKMEKDKNYLKQEYKDSQIPLLAIPTTAGTGSESTKYATIYYKGNKQSITHASIIPDFAILDSIVLKTLPIYQKKCTMLDALCQAIESWWSVNSIKESKKYSKIAIKMITLNYKRYLAGDEIAAKKIMLAANYAGRAINITQTTAAHAMSYKITSMYKLPHGHAVAVCLPHVWKYMYANLEKCIDIRGTDYLASVFKKISIALGQTDVYKAIEWFEWLLVELKINNPIMHDNNEIKILTASVNTDRLKNTPLPLNEDVLSEMYKKIMRQK